MFYFKKSYNGEQLTFSQNGWLPPKLNPRLCTVEGCKNTAYWNAAHGRYTSKFCDNHFFPKSRTNHAMSNHDTQCHCGEQHTLSKHINLLLKAESYKLPSEYNKDTIRNNNPPALGKQAMFRQNTKFYYGQKLVPNGLGGWLEPTHNQRVCAVLGCTRTVYWYQRDGIYHGRYCGPHKYTHRLAREAHDINQDIKNTFAMKDSADNQEEKIIQPIIQPTKPNQPNCCTSHAQSESGAESVKYPGIVIGEKLEVTSKPTVPVNSSPTFDPTKPVTTRDGNPVRILCTDAGDTKTNIVAITAKGTFIYDKTGLYHPGKNVIHALDLINPPETREAAELSPATKTMWLNIYTNAIMPFYTKEEALLSKDKLGKLALKLGYIQTIPLTWDISGEN